MSISIKRAKELCCEDISLIENYEEALADKTQTWICHHRKGIELNKSKKELKAMGLYYNRPACELIFLTESEHQRIHWEHNIERRNKLSVANKKRWESQEERDKQSLRFKDKPTTKYKWLKPNKKIIIMDAANVKRWHPDWKLIGPVSTTGPKALF